MGNGRRWYSGKATTVEECCVLDLLWLARERGFTPWDSGTISWSRLCQDRASLAYMVVPGENGLNLLISYRLPSIGEDVDLPIRLETTPVLFGGQRWWGR